ncbi:putative membrane protein [Sedimentisphaera cyanobacteriorum]|uniref:Putative membrane protein n=1 Tax=Sedimentisphaera cyanobacteriorum TaxID=1940790 RepID=A0A1Q2HR90_9BACT|nr:lysylphosphatidylglycerol synthase transmembrane domain-containing protein [Sedimentisphaera cyanobacteriorum]AQQ09978.1 putative membrane protein [Sedimentisphaera cyanobacteriorum]
MNRKTKITLQAAVSAALIGFILSRINLQELGSAISGASAGLLFICFVLLIPNYLLRAYRWKVLFQNSSHSITLKDSTLLLFTGLGLNLFMPSGSGDIAKAYFGYRWSGVKERMVSISFLDKLIAVSSISIPGLAASLITSRPIFAGLSLLAGIPLIFVFFFAGWISRNEKAKEFIKDRAAGRFDFELFFHQLNSCRGKLVSAVFLSILGWTVTYFIFFICFRMIDCQISLYYVFSVSPILTLARLFPFALNGLGSDEAVIGFLFLSSGLEAENVLAAALLYRVVLLIIPGLAGLVILNIKKKIITSIDKTV